MNRQLSTHISSTRAVAAMALLGLCLTANVARADESACFPLCEQAQTTVATTVATTTCAQNADSNGSMQQTINQIESINDKVKPLKEVVGYIRSPQGLAVKLVNDHVIKIPTWVGYALDPVGALKNKAIGEVRDRAKSALKASVTCMPAVAPVTDADVNEAAMKDPAHRA